jgi:hypothetical protein
LSVDWNVCNSALRESRGGRHVKAISILEALLEDAESDNDRATILLTQASCYSRLGNIVRARELLEAARVHAQAD